MIPFSLHLPGSGTNHPGRGPTAGWENIPAFPPKCLATVPKAHALYVEGGGDLGRTKIAHPLMLDSLLTHSVWK